MNGIARFRSITQFHLRYMNMNGLILVFDKTNRSSFESIPYWIEEANKSLEPNLKVLVGHKSDLLKYFEVTYDEAHEFANRMGMHYIEASAKTSQGISLIFETIIDILVLEKIKLLKPNLGK